MTIELVAKRLWDGLDCDKVKLERTVERLDEIMKREGWTIEQLDDFCWEDSNKVFGMIFGEEV